MPAFLVLLVCKNGTEIQLRKMEEKKTSPKKLPPTPEERLSRCHVAIRWLAGLLAVAILLLAVTGAMLVSTARDRGNQNNIGQNYSAVED